MKPVLLACLLCVVAHAANAQVYTGISAEGSIVLSSNEDETANTLLIEAEKIPVAVPIAAAIEPTLAWDSKVPAGFLPFIQEASETYQIPKALIHAVILVESNYNPRAYSSKGAQGLMQLMPATAKRFGNSNSWDPRQNILTGSKYLRWLLDYFGDDLELTVAAYNAGEGAVMQAGRKIPKFSETERYVPKVLSIYNKTKPQT
jgi:soluble lytic murein transglycosylase-like protein